jgi:hypothetical protein
MEFTFIVETRGGSMVRRNGRHTLRAARLYSMPANTLSTSFTSREMIRRMVLVPMILLCPTPGVVKHLKVEYAVGGKPGSVEGKDGDTLRLPPPDAVAQQLEIRSDGKNLALAVSKAGRYAVTLPGSRTLCNFRQVIHGIGLIFRRTW